MKHTTLTKIEGDFVQKPSTQIIPKIAKELSVKKKNCYNKIMENFKKPKEEITPVDSPSGQDLLGTENELTDDLVESKPEAKQALVWLQKAITKIADAWFDPKSFESEEAYEQIGVRIFKRYMPSSGDYVFRHVWKKHGSPDWVKHGDIESLKNMEFSTQMIETVHVCLFALYTDIMASQFAEGNINKATFLAVMNILVNVYPIMVQRYNRIRLYRAINNMEERNKKRDNVELNIAEEVESEPKPNLEL